MGVICHWGKGIRRDRFQGPMLMFYQTKLGVSFAGDFFSFMATILLGIDFRDLWSFLTIKFRTFTGVVVPNFMATILSARSDPYHDHE